ncbi:MAG: hypothetical protein ABIO16_05970, partial [Nocardioides sp.]
MRTRGTAGRGIAVLAVVAGGLAATTTGAWADHSIVARVSMGPTGGNGPESAQFLASTPDGSHAFFTTAESLVAADSDGGETDIYERAGGQTSLVTDGAAAFSGLSTDQFFV